MFIIVVIDNVIACKEVCHKELMTKWCSGQCDWSSIEGVKLCLLHAFSLCKVEWHWGASDKRGCYMHAIHRHDKSRMELHAWKQKCKETASSTTWSPEVQTGTTNLIELMWASRTGCVGRNEDGNSVPSNLDKITTENKWSISESWEKLEKSFQTSVWQPDTR